MKTPKFFKRFLKLDKKHFNGKIDIVILVLFLSIITIGLVCLYSASLIHSENKTGNQYFYIKQQFIQGFLPSILLFFVFAYLFNYRKLVRKSSFIVFCVSILMLFLVLIPGIGIEHGGARSWIDLGFMSFQPVEILKLTIIMFISLFFEKNKDILKSKWGGFVSCLALIFIAVVPLVFQPDLGGAIIVVAIVLSMYFFAGIKNIHLIGVVTILVLGLCLFLKIDQHTTGGVRTMRINLWLHPDNYSKINEGYQVNHGMIAVGAGGIFGRGIGKSVEKYSYMPEVMGDSIFAIIAEELGFILTVLVILIPYFLLLWRMTNIAKKTNDLYGKYFIIGVTTWICFQVFVNIGAMIRLCPLTGVPLPFVSYGSTSLWVLSAACGIVANISRKTQQNVEKTFDKYNSEIK